MSRMNSAESIRAALLASEDYRRLGAPDRMIVRGWRLSKAGRARFGWWSVTVAGAAQYLGATAQLALAEIAERSRPL